MQLSYSLNLYQSRYPNFLRLIRYDLPMLEFYQSRVYRVFVKFCASKKWADEALQTGGGPLVVVTNTCASIRGARVAGFNESKIFVNRVFYEELCVLKYEANPVLLRQEMESLVLHELVHWARRNAKAPVNVPAKHVNGEAGNEFEVACYGRDMSTRWDIPPTCE